MNAERVSKPARQISPGDTLTFPQGRAIRVIRVVSLPERRGPASEAQAAFIDLSPPERAPADGAPSAAGPRPTKKDRRNLPRF